MSLAVWSRFSDFCLDIIRLRSLYEVTTLVHVIMHLQKADQQRVFTDLSQRLIMEDVELYRWFITQLASHAESSEESAAMVEQLNINIAQFQRSNKPGKSYGE